MTNYSYETSLNPYIENQANNKQRQCDLVFAAIKKGADSLLEISEVTGILQAIVSARVNDLIVEEKVKYSEKEFSFYKDRKRKKIILINPVGTQANLF